MLQFELPPPLGSRCARAPISKLLSDLPLGRAVYLRPPELHALGDRALEPCSDPVADHRPLKFGKGAS
jgi:hypothetical protein